MSHPRIIYPGLRSLCHDAPLVITFKKLYCKVCGVAQVRWEKVIEKQDMIIIPTETRCTATLDAIKLMPTVRCEAPYSVEHGKHYSIFHPMDGTEVVLTWEAITKQIQVK